MRRLLVYGVVAMALAGCAANGALAPLEEMAVSDTALGRTIHRDPSAPVQTDKLVYPMVRRGELAYATRIPFRYRNDTGREIAIVHCHGGLDMGLEKRIDGEWQPFFHPLLLMCLSEPIRIAAGEVYADTARIHGVLPGFNGEPAFGSAELDGEYRLVWGSLVHAYDPNRTGFGEAAGPFRSNPFLLVR